MNEPGAERTAPTLEAFAELTGRPIDPAYVEHVGEALRLFAGGLGMIRIGEQSELEPATTFRVWE